MAEAVRLEGGPHGDTFTHPGVDGIKHVIFEIDGARHVYELDEDRVHHYEPTSTNHAIYKYVGIEPNEPVNAPEAVAES